MRTDRLAARRLLGAVATVVAGALLVGCSVGMEDHPVPVASGPLAAPLEPPGQDTTPTLVRSPVFFVHAGRLRAVQRPLAPGDPLMQAVAALVAGPGQDAETGLGTALPTGVTRLVVKLADGIATIEVPTDFDRLGARSEILAVGQLVFTAMALAGVRGVQLTSAGSPIEVPTDTGRLVARPVTRMDYPSIAPL